MTTISVPLDDEVNAVLEILCAGQGRDKAVLVADLVRRYVETERLGEADQAWQELERLWAEVSVDSGGNRLTRDQLHKRR